MITRIAVSAPEEVGRDAGGREAARSLLTSLQRQQDPGWRPEAGPALVETESPVFAFAPLVHLHSKDPSWPTTAESFVAKSQLVWAHGDCPEHVVAVGSELTGTQKIDPTRLAGPVAYRHSTADRDCAHTERPYSAALHTRPTDRDGRPAGLPSDEGFSLDLDDGARHPPLKRRTVDGQIVAADVPVYWERQERGSTQRITYWFFYALSQPPGPGGVTPKLVHEGDWERISVLLRVVEPGKYAPVSVRYHFHNESGDIPWAQVPTVSAAQGLATHPVVFSASGSHASYPRQGRHRQLFRGAGRDILTVNDVAIRCEDCPQWRSWELLVDARAQPWYGFGGAWGQVAGLGGAGPLGPSPFKLLAELDEVEAPVDGSKPAALPATAP